jgi:hypothetical protein
MTVKMLVVVADVVAVVADVAVKMQRAPMLKRAMKIQHRRALRIQLMVQHQDADVADVRVVKV